MGRQQRDKVINQIMMYLNKKTLSFVETIVMQREL